MQLLGTGVSAGIGIGRAVVLQSSARYVVKEQASDGEGSRFSGALEHLTAVLEKKAGAAQGEQAEILESHVMLLGDPMMSIEIENFIAAQNCNSEYAVNEVFDKYAEVFRASGDELLSARAADLMDIKNNLLTILYGEELFDVSALPAGTVLVASELTTTIAAGINPENVIALITQEGGKTSHMAIIARSIGLPAVVGISDKEIGSGETVIVNGDTGEVVTGPQAQLLEEYRARQEEQRKHKQELEELRGLLSVTVDGKEIELCANIGLEMDIQNALNADAGGVGLFRTEFLYMNRSSAPGEEVQFLIYKKAAEAFAGRPVIIRTLDVGGDKEIPYLGMQKEENPFLGWRAIRYCLDSREIFSVQLRAILRASAFGNVKIMLPMISTTAELLSAKALIESVKAELAEKSIAFNPETAVGVMIETPSAAILADRFALEADFFSIGTNDLTQYTLAVDRCNKKVAALYSAYDPAVLRLIYQVAQAAKEHGIPCGICGEAGSDPLLTKFFIGCDVDELSMVGSSILQVRKIVRGISYKDVKAKVEKGLFSLNNAKEAVQFLRGL